MAFTHRKITMWYIITALMVLKIAAAIDIVFPNDAILSDTHFTQQTAQNDFQNTEPEPVQTYENYVQSVISQGTTNLCLAMERTIASLDTTNSADHVVFSPVNIAATLALVLLGATGTTFDEISSVLGLTYGVNIANNSELVHQQFGQLLRDIDSTSMDSKQQVKFANGIFVQDDYLIRHQYRKIIERIYRGEITSLDFKTNAAEAQNVINNWVEKKTNNKIRNILPFVPPPATKVVIVSSIYFINEWETPFAMEATQRKPFYPNGKSQPSNVEIDQMATGGTFPYFFDRQLNCEILGIPYKGNKIVFYMVIPKNSNRQTLRDLENYLTVNELEKLVSKVKPTPAIVALPKMKLTSLINLNHVLQNIGLRSLFSPVESTLGILSPGIVPSHMKNSLLGRRPASDDRLIFARSSVHKNCSDDDCGKKPEHVQKRQIGLGRSIIGSYKQDDSIDYLRHFLDSNKNEAFANPGLYADQILHKVFIDVTEKGTEAAAATSVSLTRDGSRVIFKADVPFLFFIRHEDTKMILFWGTVYLPTPHYT